MATRVLEALARINRGVGLCLGLALLATVVLVLLDVVLRQVGHSLGGSDEISGYVMAAVASWGLACGLVERAHVRIDLIRLRVGPRGKAAMDLLAIIVLTGVVLLIAWYAWPVLEKTLVRGSRANTPLETPLWIPQGIWFAGWVWFAICSTAMSLCGIALLKSGRTEAFDQQFGTPSETEEVP